MLIHRKSLIPAAAILLLALLAPGCSKESRALKHLARGDKYFDSADYPKAEIEYLNVVKINQSEIHALTRLATIYEEQGRIGRAIPVIIRASDLDPDNPDVRIKAGFLHLSQGRHREAREAALFALDRTPTNPIAPILLAESVRRAEDVPAARDRLEQLTRVIGDTAPIHTSLAALAIRENKVAQAEASLRRALEIDPRYSTAHHAMGAIYWAQNDLTNAAASFKMAAESAPARSPRRTQYANFLLRTGNVEGARTVLTGITKSVPDFIPSWLGLAELAIQEKKFDEAHEFINEALLRDATHYEAILYKGRLSLALGKPDEALKEFERLNSLYERSPQAHYFTALAWLQKGDVPKSLKSLGDALAISPDHEEAVVLQAQLNLRRGNNQAAIASLRQIIEKRPRLFQAHLLLAAAYRADGNPNEAVAVCARLEQLVPRDPQVPLLTGAILREQNRNVEARRAFEKVRGLAPDFLPALEQLVDLDVTEKKFDDALNRIQREIDRSPDRPELFYLAATVHLAQDKTALSEQSLRKAIELNADFTPAYLLLARIYTLSGKHPEALQQLNDVLAKNPDDAGALLQSALINSEAKNYEAARDNYERLLKVSPTSIIALNNLAYLFSEHLNQLDRGFEFAMRGRQLRPNDPATADTLGWILVKRGQLPQALDLLEESAERLSSEPEVQFHLGTAYYLMGREEPARRALQRAVQSQRELAGRPEAERLLQTLDIDTRSANAADVKALSDKYSNDSVLRCKLAAVQLREGDVAAATASYEAALKQNPHNVLAAIRLARLCTERIGDPKRGLQLARSARSIAPDDPHIGADAGRVALDAGEFLLALNWLDDSSRRLPPNSPVARDLARAYFSVGRIDDAIAAQRRFLESKPPAPEVEAAESFIKMLSIFRQPNADDLAAVQAAVAGDASNLPALAALAAVQQASGAVTDARKSFEAILSRIPFFAPAHKHLASLYIAEPANHQKALEHALKAREAFADDADVAKALGIVYFHRNEFSRAIPLLRESALRRTTDGELFYYLGMAAHRTRDNVTARESLQRAIDLNVRKNLADEAARTLAEAPK